MFNPQPKPVPKPKAKPKRIAPRSKKRAKQEREYAKLRVEFLKEYPYCKVCCKPSTECHHMAGREGTLLCDTRYFLAVCRDCHTHIELNPEWAKYNGYSDKRLNK